MVASDYDLELLSLVESLVTNGKAAEKAQTELDLKRGGGTGEDDSLPHVSVIVIGRNRHVLLNQALRGVAELDYPKDKLHVVGKCMYKNTLPPLIRNALAIPDLSLHAYIGKTKVGKHDLEGFRSLSLSLSLEK